MKFDDAQLYIRFENQINQKTYAKIANEIGIGPATVGDIARGTYKKLKPKTNAKLEEWLEIKHLESKVIARRPNIWQRFLKFLGININKKIAHI